MNSIAFPQMLGTYKTNTVSDLQATKENLDLILRSYKDSLFGDPYFGTNLHRLIYEQNDTIVRDLVVDDIYSAILVFMPQLVVKRSDIQLTADNGSIKIVIQALNKTNQQIDLYDILLTGDDGLYGE